MTLITTTVTPEPRVQPFTGISEVARERSGIARAEVVYNAKGTWDAAGTGNIRGLIFSWDLDPDYGYVLMDCSALFIYSGSVVAMAGTAWMEITQQVPGTDESQYYQLENLPARQNSSGNTDIGTIDANDYNTLYPSGTNVGTMAFNMKYKPTGLLFPFPQVSSMSCATIFADPKTDGAQLSYRYYCRFLQYDITQGYNYVVNSPLLSR